MLPTTTGVVNGAIVTASAARHDATQVNVNPGKKRGRPPKPATNAAANRIIEVALFNSLFDELTAYRIATRKTMSAVVREALEAFFGKRLRRDMDVELNLIASDLGRLLQLVTFLDNRLIAPNDAAGHVTPENAEGCASDIEIETLQIELGTLRYQLALHISELTGRLIGETDSKRKADQP